MIEPEGSDVHRNSSSAPSMAESEEATGKNEQQLNGSSAKLKTPSPVPIIRENAFMDSWKANFEADIKARDEREVVKREELEVTAKKVCGLINRFKFFTVLDSPSEILRVVCF